MANNIHLNPDNEMITKNEIYNFVNEIYYLNCVKL